MGMAPRFNRNARAVPFVTGFKFMEGPAFDRDGNLYAVDGRQGIVVRITPQAEVSIYCRTPGGPNGSAFHPDGRLFCTDPPLKAIIEIPPGGGSYRIFADRCSEDGQPFHGPNDLRFNRNGDLYWTDPGMGKRETPDRGVYWATPDGYVRRFTSGLYYPNGLTFSADWSTLYVADSLTQLIHAYRLNPDGSAGEHTVFAKLSGVDAAGNPGLPDGIAFDEDGYLYVAHWGMGHVAVLDPAGQTVAELPIPGPNVTNLAFYGTTLYVSEGSIAGIFRLDVGVRGQPLYAEWYHTRQASG